MIRFGSLCAVLLLSACVTSTSGPGNSVSKGEILTNQPVPSGGAAINTYRRQAGLSPIRRSSRLDAAARTHASDMATRNFFSHRGSNGSTHTNRIRRQGCSGGAENLAEGPYTRSSVVAAWMGSAAHRRNILLPAVTHYGIANVGDKWVMTLSRNCP